MKRKYHIKLSNFSFYDGSPYSHLPDTEVMTFKTARKRDFWHDEFTKDVKGLLCHNVETWRK